MNIVVLVKQVPDSGSERTLRDADHRIDREHADNVINEMDEYAIEEALRLQEAHGGEVTILTMGPERAARSEERRVGKERRYGWSTKQRKKDNAHEEQ